MYSRYRRNRRHQPNNSFFNIGIWLGVGTLIIVLIICLEPGYPAHAAPEDPTFNFDVQWGQDLDGERWANLRYSNDIDFKVQTKAFYAKQGLVVDEYLVNQQPTPFRYLINDEEKGTLSAYQLAFYPDEPPFVGSSWAQEVCQEGVEFVLQTSRSDSNVWVYNLSLDTFFVTSDIGLSWQQLGPHQLLPVTIPAGRGQISVSSQNNIRAPQCANMFWRTIPYNLQN